MFQWGKERLPRFLAFVLCAKAMLARQRATQTPLLTISLRGKDRSEFTMLPVKRATRRNLKEPCFYLRVLRAGAVVNDTCFIVWLFSRTILNKINKEQNQQTVVSSNEYYRVLPGWGEQGSQKK